MKEITDFKHEAEEKALNNKLNQIKSLLSKIKSVHIVYENEQGKDKEKEIKKFRIELTS